MERRTLVDPRRGRLCEYHPLREWLLHVPRACRPDVREVELARPLPLDASESRNFLQEGAFRSTGAPAGLANEGTTLEGPSSAPGRSAAPGAIAPEAVPVDAFRGRFRGVGLGSGGQAPGKAAGPTPVARTTLAARSAVVRAPTPAGVVTRVGGR